MHTRSTIVYLMIFMVVIMFAGIGCSSDQPKEKKADNNAAVENTNAANTDTPAENTNADNAQDTNAAVTDAEQGETHPESSSQTEANSFENTAEGTGDTATANPNATEDNIVLARDAGAASVSDTGETETPVEKKEIKTRGDVNIKDKVAIIKTNYGDMYFFFFPEVAPNHVRNFIYLAEKDFYDNVKFHRIVKDFMAQGGMARPDWTEDPVPLKLEVDPKLIARHRPGALAAARTSDPDSATSQFFIDFTEERTKSLNGKYTVYGQMFKGDDVLAKLNKVKLGENPQGEMSLPLEDVHIIDVVIEDAAKYDGEIKRWKAQNDM
jgi:peptidyl-prolyl cis-trans isomerase B (cyclophilin B)